MSLFSFGGIKVATAFGGGIATVRHRPTLAWMRDRQARYPVQSSLDYLKRVLKYAAVPRRAPRAAPEHPPRLRWRCHSTCQG
jgi:hypothetical protein